MSATRSLTRNAIKTLRMRCFGTDAKQAPAIKRAAWSLAASAFLAFLALSAGAKAQDGQALYSANCLSCHQADGRGVPGVFPDLTESTLLAGDAATLLRFVLYQEQPAGFEPGQGYAVMPKFDYLGDDDLAALLSYLRSEFGSGGAISPQDVAAARN